VSFLRVLVVRVAQRAGGASAAGSLSLEQAEGRSAGYQGAALRNPRRET